MKKSDLLKCTLLVVCFLLISCSNSGQGEDQTLEDSLVGQWVEISPCESCNTLTFLPNNTIYLKNKSDATIYEISYQIVSDDSIKVVRNWDIEQIKKNTTHKIIFLTSDTLLLKQFMAVDYGITGFEDIKLIKTNKL